MKTETKISYKEIIEDLKIFQELLLEKKLEMSRRIDTAKTWAALGMSPEEIAVTIGLGPSSIANVFGTMNFSIFNSRRNNYYKKSLEDIKKYNRELLNEVNYYLNTKNLKVDTNEYGLISSESIKMLREEIEEAKKENNENKVEKMEQVIGQAAIIAISEIIDEESLLMKSINKEDIDFNNLIAPTSERLEYTSGTLKEIAKTESGRDLIQKAMNSKAIKDKYQNNPIYIYSSSLTGMKLKPSLEKKYITEEDKKKLNKQNFSI